MGFLHEVSLDACNQLYGAINKPRAGLSLFKTDRKAKVGAVGFRIGGDQIDGPFKSIINIEV